MNVPSLATVLIAMILSPISLAKEADMRVVDSVFNEVQDSCTLKAQEDECFALIEKMLTDDEYQHPTIKVILSQSLLSISGAHPKALDIAYKIAEELANSAPDNIDYLRLRISIRYRQDPIEAIWEAKNHNLAGTMSNLLNTYLASGSIQRDIKAFAIKNFEQKINSKEPIEYILSSFRSALDALARYGNDSEIEAFIASARDLIPLEMWRRDVWKNVALNKELGPDLARNVLLIYCDSMLLKLDDGELCADAIALIKENASEDVIGNSKVRGAVQWLKQMIVEEQPNGMGIVLDQLDSLEGNE